MTHAYNEEYLDDAMNNLGEAFDYAVHCQKLTLNQFAELFITSGNAAKFQTGNPKYICGISGTELVLSVLEKSGKSIYPAAGISDYKRSSAYWSGWILAYYQWYSGKSFEYIQKYLPAEEINSLYNPLHEAHELKFAETASIIIAERDKNSATS